MGTSTLNDFSGSEPSLMPWDSDAPHQFFIGISSFFYTEVSYWHDRCDSIDWDSPVLLRVAFGSDWNRRYNSKPSTILSPARPWFLHLEFCELRRSSRNSPIFRKNAKSTDFLKIHQKH
jgi:hypothetical protein